MLEVVETPLPKPKHRTTRRPKSLLVALVLLLLSAAGYSVAQPNHVPQVPVITTPGLYRVIKAVDGDTITVALGSKVETVRMIGLDTPETKDPRKPVQCFGQAAAAKMKDLVEGKEVRLEADPNDSDRDKYKRLLRYVYLPDGTLVNGQMIRQGYAFAYVVFPFAKIDEFRELERQARAENAGLWAGCSVNESTKIKQTQNQAGE